MRISKNYSAVTKLVSFMRFFNRQIFAIILVKCVTIVENLTLVYVIIVFKIMRVGTRVTIMTEKLQENIFTKAYKLNTFIEECLILNVLHCLKIQGNHKMCTLFEGHNFLICISFQNVIN